jgi:hypothetical protein
MAALVAAIHVLLFFVQQPKTWMAGTSPAMTIVRIRARLKAGHAAEREHAGTTTIDVSVRAKRALTSTEL